MFDSQQTGWGNLSQTDRRRKVLIVDDESTTSETLAFIFARHGYEARYALSAEEAIQVTAEWAPEFALIDVMLPGMDGVALAIAICSKHQGCRILLFTGDMGTAELLMSEKNRCFQILAKPISPAVLLETAKRLLA